VSALRPTWRHARATEYRRPGGPWDVPPLDAALAESTLSEPDLTVVVDGDVRLTSTALDARVGAAARALKDLGVGRGDVVAWQVPNWHEAILLYRACWRLGAVACPMHHHAGAADLDAMLKQVDPAVLLAGTGLALAERPGVLQVRGADDFGARLAEAAERPVPARASPARPSDLAAVLFTGGTTGTPKAVLHTHRGLAYKGRSMRRIHGLDARDAIVMPAPFAHVSGLLNGILLPQSVPMKTVCMERWEPERGLAIIEAERVSFMIGPTTFFVGLMGAPGFTSERVASLRLISSGAGAVTPAFVETAARTLGALVKRTYGSTEAPTVTTTPTTGALSDHERRRGQETDGRSTGDVEIRITDPVTMRGVPTGARGEVWLRGPELFVGYADADQTRAATHRGWFRTGDLGVLDEEGWLTIVGRLKDIIIRGGENIAAGEVEAHLEAHPRVHHAVAVGYPDERLGERVCAFVVADGPFDLDECQRWFAARGVARFKTPERVVQIDALPVLVAGKPDRARLREQAAGATFGPPPAPRPAPGTE
jgi:cyclohexanecarboxylate-CoA ligase